jgi:hypothetical protein
VMAIIQTVTRAKVEVQRFAKDVIRWVGELQTAFQSRQSGVSTKRIRKNLATMRYVSNPAVYQRVVH